MAKIIHFPYLVQQAGPEHLERILATERVAFTNEPHEPAEGLQKLMELGNIFIIPGVDAVTEIIELDKLLGVNPESLPQESPLRMVLENDKGHGILRRAAHDFEGRKVFYRHGTAVPEEHRRKGYGFMLTQESQKRPLSEESVVISYVMADPPNVPSLGMSFKTGGFVRRLENEVYGKEVPYFIVAHDKKTNVSVNYTLEIPFGDLFLESAAYLLSKGYSATGIIFEKPKKRGPTLLQFNKIL